jgi:hypothetical protein
MRFSARLAINIILIDISPLSGVFYTFKYSPESVAQEQTVMKAPLSVVFNISVIIHPYRLNKLQTIGL